MAIQDIVFEADFAQSPEVMWRAIAPNEGLASWLMANDLREARVGEDGMRSAAGYVQDVDAFWKDRLGRLDKRLRE